MLTSNLLVDFKNNLAKSIENLRKSADSQLCTPLSITEKHLDTKITIQPIMTIEERLQVYDYLKEYKVLIDSITVWNNQNSDTSWVELRKMIEKFASQLMPANSFDFFVINSKKVTVIPLALDGRGFAMIHLHEDHIEEPQHWCQIGHEISHLYQNMFEIEFSPQLPESKNSARYQNAVKVWSGEIIPDNAWFTEVLADLWSCQVIGPGCCLGFSNYRSTVKDIPNVGDAKHPPSDLRITIMARYLKILGFPKEVIPEYTPLNSLLPTLEMDYADYGNLRDEIFDLTIIKEVERISKVILWDTEDNSDIILENYEKLVNNSELMNNDLVTDVGALAMFSHISNEPIDPYVDELKEKYT